MENAEYQSEPALPGRGRRRRQEAEGNGLGPATPPYVGAYKAGGYNLGGYRMLGWLLAVFLACFPPSATAQPKTYPYTVVTTVGMVTDIVRQVAADKATVVGLLGAGVDPHLYKPSRDDVATLMRAQIVFYSGLMLEGKMADTLVKLARTRPVHAVTELIPPETLLEPEEMPGHHDPHVWMDPAAWAQAVEAVAQALAVFDPPNAALYRQNATRYAEQCHQLRTYGQKVMATVPEARRVLVSSHDAFNYFGRAFGLRVMGVQGLSTESEAGLQRINELVDFLVRHEVPAVFVESSVPRKSIEALVQGAQARGWRVRIGGELFSDAMGPAGTYEGTYLGMVDHNLTTVARALGGEAPARGWQGKLSAAH